MKRLLFPILLAAAAWFAWAQTVPVVSQTYSASWTTATAANAAVQFPTQNFGAALVTVNRTGTVTTGGIAFEASNTPDALTTDNWFAVPCAAPTTAGTAYDLNTTAAVAFQCNTVAYQRFRVRLAVVINSSSSGTISITSQLASIGTPVPPPAGASGVNTTVNIDQSGTHNGVQVVSALPAGGNTVGAFNQGAAGTAAWFSVPVLPPTTAGTLNTTLVVEPFTLNATSTSTFTAIKGSAANVYGYAVQNPNASVCWLEFYNATAPSLGSAVYYSVPVLGSGGIAQILPYPVNFTTALTIATTTTGGGATPCSTGMGVVIYYN